jgi:aryl-alcohol dehydrogenase-like predicted oxidoreductase
MSSTVTAAKSGTFRIGSLLHRIDPKVPRDEQFGAIKHLLDSGVIRYAGLSEVADK